MYTFLDNMFKVLKVAANNEQQKDLAALAICANNLEAIAVLHLESSRESLQNMVLCSNLQTKM
jgi:hypothetical protein